MSKDFTYSEYQLEANMGGECRCNALWYSLADIGLRFVSYFDSDTTVVFGMDAEQVYKVEIKNQWFFKLAKQLSLAPEEFAKQMLFKLTAKNKKLVLTDGKLPTSTLIWNSQSHRVLWVHAVTQLGGFRDRLFDDCYEMGDGDEVAGIVNLITGNNLLKEFKDCTIKQVRAIAESQKPKTTMDFPCFIPKNLANSNFDLFADMTC